MTTRELTSGNSNAVKGEMAQMVCSELHLEPVGGPQQPWCGHTSVVDQNIDRLCPLICEAAHRVQVRQIQLSNNVPVVSADQFIDDRIAGSAIAHCQHHPGPARRDRLRGGATDTAVRSGDQDCLIAQWTGWRSVAGHNGKCSRRPHCSQ